MVSQPPGGDDRQRDLRDDVEQVEEIVPGRLLGMEREDG